MNWKNFKAGIAILDKYLDGTEYPLDADHDVLYVGPPGLLNKVSEEDAAKLEELDWMKNRELDVWQCFT